MVYCIQESPGKNILPAAEYGEIKVLLPENRNIMFSAGAVCEELRVLLSNFSDADYLLLIGDPAAIGVAVAIALQWNKNRAKLLKWDRQERRYYPVSIDLNNKRGELYDERIAD
jgi:hypothetical protein